MWNFDKEEAENFSLESALIALYKAQMKSIILIPKPTHSKTMF
jgi:hypothetical protein